MKPLLLSFYLLMACSAFSQQQELRYTPRPLAMGSLPPVEVTDDVQKLFIKQQWSPGVVTLKTSGQQRQLPLLFDVYNNQLFYQQNGQVMEFLDPVQQFSMGIIKKDDSIQVVYRSGYPPVQRNDEATFYELLADGPVQLLRCKAKSIYLAKEDIPEEERGYKKEMLYASLPDGKIIPVKKDKDYLVKQMPAQAAAISQLTEKHKLKLKNEAALVQLFRLLNQEH
ncbi:hypothetical protein SAMN05444008_113107 [Cnuella takakiae]|uniref:GLPGLI family protein n=1 Tax=Cnuella takakiae TaxID=1302690 RepID=A0A1M5F9Z7_9BACT|nr:hypothetical protein [Cnuella takakiae]OLY91030.1 hypothetical protein BUE76_03290 [Cnuella takakiae]SHF88374.1 hypothetical protein SAMN05444008_113107 [Cnuella takakiae]